MTQDELSNTTNTKISISIKVKLKTYILIFMYCNKNAFSCNEHKIICMSVILYIKTVLKLSILCLRISLHPFITLLIRIP